MSCISHFKYQLEEGIRDYCTKELNLETVSIPDNDLMITIEQNVTFIHHEQDLLTKKKSYTITVQSNATLQYILTYSPTNTATSRSTSMVDEAETTTEVATEVATKSADVILNQYTDVRKFVTQKPSYAAILFTGLIMFFVVGAVLGVAAVLVESHAKFKAPVVGISLTFIATRFDVGLAKALLYLVGCAKVYSTTLAICLISPFLFASSGIINGSTILGATGGAYAGALIGIATTGIVFHDTVRALTGFISKAIGLGTFIWATVAGLTETVTGNIVGTIIGTTMGILIAKAFNEALTAMNTLKPSNIIMIRALEFIERIQVVLVHFATATDLPQKSDLSSSTPLLAYIGAIIGTVTGAFTGIFGGALIGVFIGAVVAGIICVSGIKIKKTSNFASNTQVEFADANMFTLNLAVLHTPPIRVVNEVIYLVFGATIGAALLYMVGAFAGRYLATALVHTQHVQALGDTWPGTQRYVLNVIKAATGVFNIAGYTGGLLAGISIRLCQTVLVTSTIKTNFKKTITFATLGAVVASVTAAVDEAVCILLWIGIIGSLALFLVTRFAETNFAIVIIISCGEVIIVGGLIGVTFAAHFIPIYADMIKIIIVIASVIVVILTTTIYIAKIFYDPSKKCVHIPLNDVVKKFGEVAKSSIDQGDASDNWIQYKITLQ